MRCPKCGTDHIDLARFCSNCGATLGTENKPAMGVRNDWTGTSGRTASSALSIASFAMLLAVALLSVGFVLYVYYVEGFIVDYWNYGHLSQRISEAMQYSIDLGELAMIVGLVFVAQALLIHQNRGSLISGISNKRLSSVKFIFVLAAIALAFNFFTALFVNELDPGIGRDWAVRLTWYPARFAWIVVAFAFLRVSMALRDSDRQNP